MASSQDAFAGVAPEQTAGIQNLRLSDGHQIPLLGYGTGTARAKIGQSDVTNTDQELVDDIVLGKNAKSRFSSQLQIQ